MILKPYQLKASIPPTLSRLESAKTYAQEWVLRLDWSDRRYRRVSMADAYCVQRWLRYLVEVDGNNVHIRTIRDADLIKFRDSLRGLNFQNHYINRIISAVLRLLDRKSVV